MLKTSVVLATFQLLLSLHCAYGAPDFGENEQLSLSKRRTEMSMLMSKCESLCFSARAINTLQVSSRPCHKAAATNTRQHVSFAASSRQQ